MMDKNQHEYYVLDVPLSRDVAYDVLYLELFVLEQSHRDWVTSLPFYGNYLHPSDLLFDKNQPPLGLEEFVI